MKNCIYKYIFGENGGNKRDEINKFWSHIILDSYKSGQTNELEGEIATAVQV